jgi:hypothetical protein
MTRDQDFERQLADWLESGPVVAPTEVVDRAIEQTRGRRQRRAWWSWAHALGDRLRSDGRARPLGVALILVLTLLATFAVAVPLAGGPSPAPEMDPLAARAIAGNARVFDETASPTGVTRVVDIQVGDPRVDGQARQELEALLGSETGIYHRRGIMRLENAWGSWQGPVDVAGYPTGEEFEFASLTGSGAYEGFVYLHTVRIHPSGAGRAVEGAIWPDEPPPIPDPSLLP